MKPNGIEHVFFDLDHTLWDFDRNSELTFKKIFDLNDVSINLSEFLEIYVPINLYYWKLYREDKIDKSSLRYKRLNDVFTKLGIKVKTSLIYKLSEDYISYLSTFNHLFEGTIEILEYLEPRYKMHIITNGFKEVQNGKLKNAKIDRYFETITNSEMVGVKKPNPKIFRHALKAAGTSAEKSIMIGDNYEADILGALNMGFDTICFNYHKESLEKEIKQIDSLLELKRFL
jgi:putative hydrolase of the HAD superfamily